MAKPRRWIAILARAGYAARGLVYAIVGLFAVLAAIGAAQEKDTQGALQQIFQQPFGRLMVWMMIVALAGYVLWRLVQAIFDTDRHGNGAKALAIRAGLLASAVTYATLTFYALSLLGVFTDSGGAGGPFRQPPLAEALAGFVGSQWVALGLSLIFAGIAMAHWFKAVTRRYQRHFLADGRIMDLIHVVSILGLGARGVVFAVISVLFLLRFRRVGETQGSARPGLKEALQFIQDLPFGAWLLAILGVGLVAFAVYSAAEAGWRRVNVEATGQSVSRRSGDRFAASKRGKTMA